MECPDSFARLHLARALRLGPLTLRNLVKELQTKSLSPEGDKPLATRAKALRCIRAAVAHRLLAPFYDAGGTVYYHLRRWVAQNPDYYRSLRPAPVDDVVYSTRRGSRQVSAEMSAP